MRLPLEGFHHADPRGFVNEWIFVVDASTTRLQQVHRSASGAEFGFNVMTAAVLPMGKSDADGVYCERYLRWCKELETWTRREQIK